ncbi:hypothetical protein IWW42_003310 [Coemansia sp. RSA 1085]|nr:hypothetical protein IWW42_003310 [Coemansia sp. RSA 1085]
MWEASPKHIEYDSFDDEVHGAPQTYGGIRQMEQTSLTSARERIASSSSNPYATLHHINRELMELGLPSPLMLPELPECLEDNQRVVDCLVQLLQQRKKDLGFREAMEDELRKAMGEEDMLRSTITRLERELDQAQREAALNRIRWEEAERASADLEKQRKRLANELRTTRSNAAMVKTQYMHDSKKREQEMDRVKDRMQKLITDKHKTAKLSVELVNPGVRDRVAEAAGGRDRRLVEELVGRYEATEVQLIAKIEALQGKLRQMARALGKLHGDVVGDEAVSVLEEGEEPDEAAVEQALQLVGAVRQHVLADRARAQHEAAGQGELQAREEQIGQLHEETARLESEIADLKHVMAEQKRLIDQMAREQQGRSGDMLEMSFSEMSLEQLDAEREAVRRERQQLEEERKRFTDAAIELGNERGELKRERDEFERLKTAQGTSELVSGLPPTPQWMKGMDTSQATPMILHQLQGMYNGTPTNALLASMAAGSSAAGPNAAGPNAPSSAAASSNALDEQFPEIAASPEPAPAPAPAPLSSQRTSVQSTPAARTAARASVRRSSSRERTPAQPARTPAQVRSGRQARVCTRPGCAAHAPHTHEDGSQAAVMELKPPVPRFRRKAGVDSAETPRSHSASQQRAHAADIFK